MTSPQVFETIERPFTAQTWLDLVEARADGAGSGLMCLHDGGQQFFRDEHGVRALLTMYDAWDEDRYNGRLQARLCLLPHGPMTDADRARRAVRMMSNWAVSIKIGDGGELPAAFGPLEVCGAPNVLAHAFFRESMKSGEHLPDWAGHRMFKESDGACDHPYCVRLVEWGGEPATVTLKLAGPVAMAAKTNLLGEVRSGEGQGLGGRGWSWGDTGWLEVQCDVEPPAWGKAPDGTAVDFRGQPLEWSAVTFAMRPREIATIMCDMVLGRKEWRDLDAKREVWATVHREDEGVRG
jgi:alpha-mannosidase